MIEDISNGTKAVSGEGNGISTEGYGISKAGWLSTEGNGMAFA